MPDTQIPRGMPLVSIVTVVYNGEKYLAKTIESVARQTYRRIEHIVLDGGSRDGTLEIIRNYEQYIAYWKSEPDKGLADAMNKSIQYCKGQFTMFLHADDTLADDAIEQLVNALSHSQKRWAMGFYKYVNSRGEITKEDKLADYSYFDMLLRNIVRHQATLVPTNIFETIRFDNKFRYAMDYMFFLKVWSHLGPPEIIRKHLAYFRLDGSNLSSNFYASIKDEMNVRKEFRRITHQTYMLPFDYVIYYLRVLKIFVYHSRTQHVE